MTAQDKRVGLWCSDNVIRFTDGTVLRDITAPNRLLASIMSGGKLTVYVANPDILDSFMAHVVHSIPHNEHNSSASRCVLTAKIPHDSSTYRIFCEKTAVSP